MPRPNASASILVPFSVLSRSPFALHWAPLSWNRIFFFPFLTISEICYRLPPLPFSPILYFVQYTFQIVHIDNPMNFPVDFYVAIDRGSVISVLSGVKEVPDIHIQNFGYF